MAFFDELKKKLAKADQIVKIAWIGLDGAGKTTLLKKLTQGLFSENTKRTLGMNLDEFVHEDVRFICWDIGGQVSFRDTLWNKYVSGSLGVVFVIDASSPTRFSEAKGELWKYVIENKEVMAEMAILVLANKQDKEGAVPAGQVARALDLHKVTTKPYAIVPVSAKTGFNLDVAIEWLKARITEKIENMK